jgi:PKD repeat protein
MPLALLLIFFSTSLSVQGQAIFSGYPSTGCAPLVVNFNNSSAPGTNVWDFGDGTPVSYLCSPSHVFAAAGTYTVTLIVNGTDTATQTITVNPSPTPSFSGDTAVCVGSSGSFAATFHTGSSYAWSVTNGTYTASGTSMTFYASLVGYATITLTETNSYGCSKKTKRKVYVAPLPDIFLGCDKRENGSGGLKITNPTDTNHGEPKDTFVYRTCRCAYDYDTFDMGYNSGIATTYTWYINNGTIISGQGTPNVIVQWGGAGTGSIKVIGINIYGCEDSATCLFDICPGTSFTASGQNACLGNANQFNATGIDITSWSWDFGDGSYSALQNPTHVYTTSGIKTIKVGAVNVNGCFHDTTFHVYVNPSNGPPVFCPGTVCEGSTVKYYSTLYGGATYHWNVSGNVGGVITSGNGDTITVTWGSGPVGIIKLKVNGGPWACNDTVYINIPIVPHVPPIYGNTIVCPGAVETYSAPVLPGTQYTWTIAGGTITSNPNGMSVNVHWNSSIAGPHWIKLVINNSLLCCSGINTLNITELQFLNFTGDLNVCANTSHTYYLPAGVSGTFNVQGGTATYTDPGGNYVTVLWGSAGTGHISASTGLTSIYCNPTPILNVNINALPVVPTLSGLGYMCVNGASQYTFPKQSGVNYVWSITGGAYTATVCSTATTDCRNITFTSVGTYTISVTGTSIYFPYCASSAGTYTVNVVGNGVPSVTGNLNPCQGATEAYSIPSNPGNIYQWEVIGGTITTGTNISTNISITWGDISPGIIIIRNTICGTNATTNVNIKATPTVVIQMSDSNCAGSSVKLTVFSDTGSTYLWSPGGSTSSFITVTTGGTYSVLVNDRGCTATQSILVSTPLPRLPNPTVDIIKTPIAHPGSGLLYEFSASTTNCSGCIYSWVNYPSGTPVSGGTGSSIFVTDTNQYKVTVTNSYGCTSMDIDSLQFGGGGTGTGGCDTTVTHCACGGGGCLAAGGSMTLSSMSASSYLWTPGGATTQSITVTSPGTYCVDRTISGTTYTCCFTVLSTPVASYTYSGPPCNTVSFNSSSSTGGSIYYWDFGDGTYSNDVNPVHVYTNTGSYTVQLSVSNGACWSTVASHTFSINRVLDANFTYTQPACAPSINFNSGSSITIPAAGVTYAWNFGDAGTSTSANPTHLYATGGTYNVSLSIMASGCTSTVTKPVMVHYLKAQIGGCPACVSQSAQYVDNSIHTDPIISWSWDFGDGSPVSGLQHPWHVYTATGAYTVTLTVTDTRGCVSVKVVNITVGSFTAGTLSFSGPTSFCEGGSVTITAPGGFEYIWNNGANTQTVTATETGLYRVIVINASGCKDTLEQFVTVNPVPVARVEEGSSFTICGNTNLILHALSDGSYTQYKWTNPAGAINYSNPYYLYPPTEGSYTLMVTNSFGCTASTNFYIDTIFVPTPTITASPTSVCFGNPVTLTVSSGGGTVTSYEWFNGANTSSITIMPVTTNNYWVDVTYSTGCKERAYIWVTVNPTPDVSLMPKGCYKVCKGYTPSVYGPVPAWGSYDYYWYDASNPTTPVSTTNPFVITGTTPASYYLVVKDPITGCTSTSAIFSIDYVDPPAAHIDITGQPIICSSAGNTVTLTAQGAGMGYSYLWSNGATTSSITVNQPGWYVVKVSISDCCWDKDSVFIDSIADCCWDSTVDFTIIPDGTVINGGTVVWKGKYYIAGLVTVTGATEFDLTHVDLVFSTTGEIRMNANSFMRANTSVFRPCHIEDNWVGFTFQESAGGYIDKCVYKNATNAIYVQGNDEKSVRIIDNTFIDCYTGIRIENRSSFAEGITGNTFTIDNHTIFPTIERYGIFLDRVFMEDMISQNDFRNADRTKQPFQYTGIYMRGGKAVISSNTFTNMYRSMDISGVEKFVNIENNKIEVTFETPNRNVQIRVSDTRVPAVIFNNDLFSSAPSYASSTSGFSTAIYVEKNYYTNIRQNHIKGFEIGVWSQYLFNSQIVENLIERAKVIGVVALHQVPDEIHSLDIACNKIYMDKTVRDFWIYPIGILSEEDNQNDRIRTNCIFDCYMSIYTYTNSGVNLPDIRNNYLFNYFYGVNNSGHNGNVGSPGGFSTAGRNSFISNNTLLAIDINSNVGIGEDGNYSINTLSGVWSYGGYPFNSTSSCGQQFTNPRETQFDEVTVCDQYKQQFGVIKRNLDGDMTAIDFEKRTIVFDDTRDWPTDDASALDGPLSPAHMHTSMDVLYNNGAAGEFGKLMSAINNYTKYSAADKQRFALHKYILENDYTAANNLFATITPVNEDDADWLYIQQVNMQLKQKGLSCKTLTTAQLGKLSQIDDRRGMYAAVARDMVNMAQGEHPYIFGNFKSPEITKNLRKLDRNEDLIEIMPNPNNGSFKLRLNVAEAGNEGIVIEISNTSGAIVFQSKSNSVAGEFMVNLPDVSAGMYNIAVKTNNKVLHTRFIKL